MTYPYGKREKIKIVWEDACKSSKIKLTKGGAVFEGTGKYCGEQAIRWLTQKDFIDPLDLLMLALKMDIRLFGRLLKMWEDEKNKVETPHPKVFIEEKHTF